LIGCPTRTDLSVLLDAAPESLTVTTETDRVADFPRSVAIQRHTLPLAFDNDAFDVVLSFDLHHRLLDTPSLDAEIRRVLSVNGTLLVSAGPEKARRRATRSKAGTEGLSLSEMSRRLEESFGTPLTLAQIPMRAVAFFDYDAEELEPDLNRALITEDPTPTDFVLVFGRYEAHCDTLTLAELPTPRTGPTDWRDRLRGELRQDVREILQATLNDRQTTGEQDEARRALEAALEDMRRQLADAQARAEECRRWADERVMEAHRQADARIAAADEASHANASYTWAPPPTSPTVSAADESDASAGWERDAQGLRAHAARAAGLGHRVDALAARFAQGDADRFPNARENAEESFSESQRLDAFRGPREEPDAAPPALSADEGPTLRETFGGFAAAVDASR
ncbi:MAG: methyltransferase domain-containing protein, partial [Myxococcota bacterium]